MRCSIGLCSSPRQYAPATLISLTAPISPVVRVPAAAQVGELADRVERDRFALGDLARSSTLNGLSR